MNVRVPDSDLSALNSFTTERSFDFGRGVVHVRKYTWLHPTTDVWTANKYLLDLPLSRRPGPAQATYLDTRRKVSDRLGRILFVPPGRIVESGTVQGHQRSMQCLLSADMVEELVGSSPTWSDAKLAEGLSLNSPEVEWLLRRIYREVQDEGFAARIMVESLASALAVSLVRKFGLDVGTSNIATGGLSPWRMRLIRTRAEEERTPPSLTELATLCDMSVRHLCRAFRAETGQTVARFIEDAVMERARDLLSRDDVAISEVARELGYSSVGTFSYAFRRATGARPSEVARRRRTAARRVHGN